jgi:hypothetical protein
MDWKDFLRGGGTGRGGDPYVNEKSLFAKYPLPPKNAAPLKKTAVAAAAAAPGALWKQPTPPHDLTPRGGPGGGTMTGQAPPNPLQAAVDAGGHGYPQIARDQGYGMQQMADTGRLGATAKMGRLPQQFDDARFGGGGSPFDIASALASDPAAGGGGLGQGDPRMGRLPQQYPTVMEDQQATPNDAIAQKYQHYMQGGGGLIGLLYRRQHPNG